MGIRFRLRRPVTVTVALTAPPPSDAKPAHERPKRGKPDPEIERRRRIRRGVIVFFMAVVFVGGAAAALFADRGYLDVRRSRAEMRELQTEVDEELARLQALKAEVKRLQSDPTAIERFAREELGLSKRGEIQFLLPWDDERQDLWRLGGPSEPGAGDSTEDPEESSMP